MSSAGRAPEGGDLAHGPGDGAEVLTQNRTVVARDLRADPDVRGAGSHPDTATRTVFHLVAPGPDAARLRVNQNVNKILTAWCGLGRAFGVP